MSSEPELADVIQLGHDITSFKFYAISATALWFYDYLLTVDDEFRYAWRGGNNLMFVMFLLVRYFPAPALIWTTIASWSPGYTPEMCKKTGFIELLFLTFITTCAQIVLSQRTYAITMRSKWVAGILYTGTAVQFVIGSYMLIYSAVKPVAISTIPLDSYHLCLPILPKVFTIVDISLALGFDIVVCVLVVVQAQIFRTINRGTNVPNLLSTVSKDTVIYFAVISSSHLLVVIMFSVARPMLRAVATVGNAVLIPLMIVRMIISLRKAASDSQLLIIDVEIPCYYGTSADIEGPCPPRQGGGIQLAVLEL